MFFGVLKPAEHEFSYRKFLRYRIKSSHVNFPEISTLQLDLEIGFIWAF